MTKKIKVFMFGADETGHEYEPFFNPRRIVKIALSPGGGKLGFTQTIPRPKGFDGPDEGRYGGQFVPAIHVPTNEYDGGCNWTHRSQKTERLFRQAFKELFGVNPRISRKS